MKKSDLLKLVETNGDEDEIDEILKSSDLAIFAKEPTKEIVKDIKSNTAVTMTAAEFMQVFANFSPKKEDKKEAEDNAEIYIQ